MKKVAIIGYGGMGKWHCDRIRENKVVELGGIYDINELRRELAHEEGIFVYNSNEEIFSDPTIDIIVVATPNDVHEELIIKALSSGKNAICEKPATLSVESFDRMVEAQNKSGKLLSVHQNRRWDAEHLAIKSFVKTKELGEIIRIENRVHGSRGIPGDWRKEKKYGGGMIYDWGVHLIDQTLQIIPEKIIEVNCVSTYITNSEVDDGFRLELTFESGKTAHIEVGTYNFLTLPRFYVQCENGTAIIPDWNNSVQLNKMTKWVEKNVVPVKTSAGITKTMAPRDVESCEKYEIELPKGDVHDFYRNFVNAIDKKEEQRIKNSEVRRVLQVIEAAFESNEIRQRLKLEI